jgi:quercetin dioxygenase-like cupin family protein
VSTTRDDTIRIGPLGIRFVVEADASGGGVTAFECSIPAAARMPAPHSHDAFEETVYGVAGEAVFTVAGERHVIGPGDALCIRRGTIHAFENLGPEDATVLCVTTPGRLGRAYFEEIAAVVAAAGGGPPDVAAMGEVMRRHGLTPAPA